MIYEIFSFQLSILAPGDSDVVGLAIVNTIIGGCGGGLTVLFANKFLVTGIHAQNNLQLCSVLEKSPFGAKSDFEIWVFEVFCSLDQKKAPKKAWKWPHQKI